MTTTTSSPEKEIECCPVCYEGFEEQHQEEDDENADENADVEMGTLPIGSGRIELECNHVFCRNCLLEYCRHNIQMKRIPIPCPTIGNISKHKHDKFADCEQVLQNHLVEDILLQSSSSTTKARRGTPDDHDDDNDDNDDKDKDAQHLIKFRRFQQMAQDPTLLPCPKCDELVSQVRQQMKDQEQAKQHGHGLVASSSENKEKDNKDNLKENINNKDKVSNDNDARLSCHSCYHTFCAVHGDAHPGIPCSDYARSREARQIRQSEKSLEQWTKSCSHVHCGARIHKAEGCDHGTFPLSLCSGLSFFLFLGSVCESVFLCSVCESLFLCSECESLFLCSLFESLFLFLCSVCESLFTHTFTLVTFIIHNNIILL
jgi:hypothetical protein